MFILQYGPIVEIDLKIPPRPPGYAFVEVSTTFSQKIITNTIFLGLIKYLVLEFRIYHLTAGLVSLCYFACTKDSKYDFLFQFEDSRDADDAIRGRDGYDFDGCRLRVSYVIVILW